MMKKFKVLDLFAGCGGLSKGFEMAGFEIVAANEYWEPAAKTYKKNHPDTKFSSKDITLKEAKNEIYNFFTNESCDVIIGGPPCQAYSIAGLRDPNDPRGDLFNDYLEIVAKLKPKVVVLENVKGLVTMKQDKDNLSAAEKIELLKYKVIEKEKNELLLLRRRHKNNQIKFHFGPKQVKKLNDLIYKSKEIKNRLETHRELISIKIISKLEKLGYKVKFEVLNSANYGVPQKRERVIFIGVLGEENIEFPIQTHTKSLQLDLTLKTPWVTVGEAIEDLKEKEGNAKTSHIFTTHSQSFIRKIEETPVGKSVFGGYSDAFFRNPPNEPSRTIKENHGSVLVHYEKHRVMTPRELARLQSFPDNFLFEGSKSQILKQIGNAVPPLLGKAIGIAVLQIFNQSEITELETKSIVDFPRIIYT